GLTIYGTPMNLVFDGDSMYCGVFSPIEGVGGVFRAPVPEGLGINEMQISPQPVLYPNPAKDFVTLQFPKEQLNNGALIITDVLGRQTYNKSIRTGDGNSITVSTESWSSGLYFYNIVLGKSKTSGKFIVE